MGEPEHSTLRLGEDWTVEPRRLRLSGPRGSHRLEPKVLDVLLALAHDPGRVVSKEELLDRVWGTPHVSEEVVRRAVYELRKLFGDDSTQPYVIETIPRSGYRLLLPVHRLPSAGVPRSRPGLLLAGLAIAMTSLIAWIAVSLTLRQEEAPPETQSTPFTTYPGLEFDPAFAPDGSRIAFIGARDDGTDSALYVKLVDREPAVRLVSAASDPTWTPDGQRICFVARAAGAPDWQVQEVAAVGGPSRRVLDLGQRKPFGLAASPDGRWLAFGWAREPDLPFAIHLFEWETGAIVRLTDPPSGIGGDGMPAWSPDGSELVFVRSTYSSVHDLYAVSIDGGSTRRLTTTSRKIADVDWSPDGDEVLFSQLHAGTHRLFTLPARGGGEPRAVAAGEGAMSLSVDRTSGRLAYARYSFEFTFQRLDLETGESTPYPHLSSTSFDSEPSVSPDGSRISFVSTRSGSFEVWVSGVDGTEIRRLTDFGGAYTGEPSWSEDGRWIAFTSAQGGDTDIWRVDPRGGIPERLTHTPSQEVAPRFSRDGRWLYFASTRSGRWELWRQSLSEPDAAAQPLTNSGGHRLQESADGWLYFTRRRVSGLWRQRPESETPELAIPDLSPRQSGNWAVTRNGVLFVDKGTEQSPVLLRWDPSSREVRPVASLQSWPMNPSLAVEPEGHWLVYSQGHEVKSDLFLVRLF